MIRIDQKAVLDAKTVTKNERKILQNLPVLGDYSKRKTNCKLSEALGRLMALVSKHRRGLDAAVVSKPQQPQLKPEGSRSRFGLILKLKFAGHLKKLS
mgnify:CR=1 FL=1